MTARAQRDMLQPMSKEKPAVLIADDDPASLLFLSDTFVRLGCRPEGVESGTAALRAAAMSHFDLILLDCRMPDCGGAELLARLREQGVTTPAVATSATIDAPLRAQLHAAGFADVLEKPATVAQMRGLLRHLGPSALEPAATLDDAAAARALGGDDATVRALRSLLAQELAALMTETDLAADPSRLRERLHRLRASCGFCGATALAASAAELEAALAVDSRRITVPLQSFRAICAVTATALRD